MTALKAMSAPRAAFDDKIVIYLEGREDVLILKHCWFADETNVEFCSAGRAKKTGGCSFVKEIVTAVMSGQPPTAGASDPPSPFAKFDPGAVPDAAPVFGLVDRDALYFLAQQRDLFFEPDDATFDQRCAATEPFGPNIRPLRRWEIESYLVAHASVVADVLKAEYFESSEDPRYGEDTVAGELVRHGHSLIPVIAANLALHNRSLPALDDGFGQDVKDPDAVSALVRQKLDKQLQHDAEWSTEIDAHSQALKKFDNLNTGASMSARWERLSRMVDAKRLLGRLQHSHKSRRMRGHLAKAVKYLGLVDDEFRGHIKHFQQIARRQNQAQPLLT